MKKLLGILVLGLLWCNVGFAAENAEELNKNCIKKGTTEFNKKVKQRVKKNFVTVMYFGCKSMASWYWYEETSKDLDTSHQVAYKKCLKGASEYKIETCHLFAINNTIVWGKDAAFVKKVEKDIKTKFAKNVSNGCVEGNCINGQGTQIFSDGYKYVGEFKNGLRSGQGTATWAALGDKYVGEFKDDKANGLGTHTWKDGEKYVGEHKNGKKHGQGTTTRKDGYKYVGEYKNDKRHGQGTDIWPESFGYKYVGEFKNGKKHGQGTETRKGEKKYVGEFKYDERITIDPNRNYAYRHDIDIFKNNFLKNQAITKENASTFKKLTLKEETTVVTQRGLNANDLDKRKTKISFKSFKFIAEYEENFIVEMFIEYREGNKNLEEAESIASYYAHMFGQMPHFLKVYTDKIYVHKDVGKDDGVWWAMARKREFHINRSRCVSHTFYKYTSCATTMIHELAHILKDLTGEVSPSKWLKAKNLDNKKYCTKYSKKNNEEDFAESMVCWIAVRHLSNKLKPGVNKKLNEFIPNRLKFFDEMNFNMYPM